MKRIRKCCHRWILDSFTTCPPPFTVLVVCVFGSVFSIGFWCAHWIDKINLGSYKFYDATSDNIGGYQSIKLMSNLLPIDVVYTWVNGSDPYVLENMKQITDFGKLRCSHANCYPSPYYTKEIMDNSRGIHPSHSTFIQISKVQKGNASKTFVISHGKNDFMIRLEAEVKNSSLIQQAYWTSDTNADWSIAWKRGLIIALEAKSQINEEISKYSPQNYENFTKNCTVVEHLHTFIVECLDETLSQTLLRDIQNYRSEKKLKFPQVWEAHLILHSRNTYNKEFDINRFDDNEELRYSLRSLEKFAPWVRRVFLVTNGQIPNWINLDHAKIRVVTHQEIFTDPTHLPTFSSPAIESHIHRIPGLSEHFLYLNDDIMLGDAVWPDDFYSPSTGYKIYLSWSLPECSSGCSGTWINDGFCDQACNTTSCHWDGGDCTGPGRQLEKDVSYYVDGAEEDIFQSGGELCSASCADSWLADSFCDGVCNSPSCGFDAGDCGLEVVKERVLQLPFEANSAQNAKLTVPKGTLSAWIDIEPFLKEDKNITLKGSYSIVKGVRVAAANVPLGAMFLVFKANFSGSIQVEMNFTKESKSSKIQFHIKFDTYPVIPDAKLKETLNNGDMINFSFENLSPKIFNETYKLYGNKISELRNDFESGMSFVEEVKALHDRYVNGELSEEGFKWKKLLLARTYNHSSNNNGPNNSAVPSRSMFLNRKLLVFETDQYSDFRDQFSDFRLTKNDGTLGSFWGNFPWEKNRNFFIKSNIQTSYTPSVKTGRRLLDSFADSLLYVNQLYNNEYGFEARKVPAHMPHFMNKNILVELHEKFNREFEETSSHKIRQGNDMQFAFSYFYYLMSEKKEKSIREIFDEFDTDLSGTWSDREIRTFLTKTCPLPLQYKYFSEVHDDIKNCTQQLTLEPVSTPPYERYADSDVPTVSKELVLKCTKSMLRQKMQNLKSVPKFSVGTVTDSAVHFKMMTSNVSSVVYHLDDVRKNSRKFICINNNLEPGSANNDLVRALMQDLYESLYPIPSSFELPLNYRNRFTYTWQLEEWRRWKNLIRSLIYAFLSCLILLSLTAFFGTEVRNSFTGTLRGYF